MLIQFTHNT
uniref:Uncharacterized protein n=1 Tax=Anguilla anguilla TaxID=7936 RepID=A0A0E9Q6A4_ANGAN